MDEYSIDITTPEGALAATMLIFAQRGRAIREANPSATVTAVAEKLPTTIATPSLQGPGQNAPPIIHEVASEQ